MDITISLLGAIVALVLAIGLILKKVSPAYGMMIGALIGALIGGATLAESVELMIEGARGIMSAVLRILAAGILAGVLIESGGAKSIAETLISKFGEKYSLLALTIATLVLTASGVFIDIAVITVAPIALTIAGRLNISKLAIIVAMVGGGKAGNIMSANPNAIAASDAFEIPLTSLMAAGIVPAIFGVIVTFILAKRLVNKGQFVEMSEITSEEDEKLPSFWAALSAPIVAILLLALRPISIFFFKTEIVIDPMIALPVGGLFGAIAMGKITHINDYASKGLLRMSGVAIMLIGTGTLAAVVANSELKTTIIDVLSSVSVPEFLLAPISGSMMSFATASTTAGTATASEVFGPTILAVGVAPLAAAAMIQAGATVLDHMPHGSFFHSTGGSLNMGLKERLKAVPYESLIGLVLTIAMTIGYVILR